ncbi:hypothetical protein [Synechococcus sp. H55.10]|uniref:hypothetical protein n=1 Tax=Synechococcus sp. H55.10 TaxID=2964503 RepID=UPI0039C5AF10
MPGCLFGSSGSQWPQQQALQRRHSGRRNRGSAELGSLNLPPQIRRIPAAIRQMA